jgi:hypothetical protein
MTNLKTIMTLNLLYILNAVHVALLFSVQQIRDIPVIFNRIGHSLGLATIG